MVTSSSTQRGSLALPQDTAPKTSPTPKQPQTSSTVVARRQLTPVYGSSFGDLIRGMPLCQKERVRDFRIQTWESGQYNVEVVTPTKPTETTSNGRSGS